MKFLENTTLSDIFIDDTGINLLASSTYTIPVQDYLVWAKSTDIITHVNSGDVIVNDGNNDLSVTSGLNFLQYPDTAFNSRFLSDPERVNGFSAKNVQEAIEEVATAVVTGTIVGQVIDFAGATPPNKHLVCDGSAVSRVTYAPLFSVIGTIWGVGDGSTTFNIPNLEGLPAWGVDGTNPIGTITGSDSVNLAHSHTEGSLSTNTVSDHNHSDGTLATDTAAAHTHSDGTLATDSAAAHTHTMEHTHQIDPPNTTTTAAGTVASGLLGLLVNAAPAGHTHDVNIAAFTSGATSASNTGSAGSHSHDVTGNTGSNGSHSHDVTGSTGSSGSHSHIVTGTTSSALSSVDKRPARAYLLKCIRFEV